MLGQCITLVIITQVISLRSPVLVFLKIKLQRNVDPVIFKKNLKLI